MAGRFAIEVSTGALDDVSREIVREAQGDIVAAIHAVMTEAEQVALSGWPVDSGDSRQTILLELTDQGATLSVGARYAGYIRQSYTLILDRASEIADQIAGHWGRS